MNVNVWVSAFTFENPTLPGYMCRLDTINGPRTVNDKIQGYPQIAVLSKNLRFVSYIGKVEVTAPGEVLLSNGEDRWNAFGYFWSEGSPIALPVQFECVVRTDRSLKLTVKSGEEVLFDTGGFITSASGQVIITGAGSLVSPTS